MIPVFKKDAVDTFLITYVVTSLFLSNPILLIMKILNDRMIRLNDTITIDTK